MPLVYHKDLIKKGEIGIWRIEETEAFFDEKLILVEEEAQQLSKIKGGRRVEWLASRYLLHKMSGRTERGAFLKDEYGKPHLEDSDFEVSISHSNRMVAVIAAPYSIGVDIQKIVTKIERIAHKYMRDEETASLIPATRLEHLHVYWGAKEALYKAYGRRQLDFKKHIWVEPFEYNLSMGTCKGQIIKDDFQANFLLHYEKIKAGEFGDYILVYAMQE